MQNKMHWAAHGHTAAEVIHRRADASQKNMGLTAWEGDRPRKTDVSIAKNDLNQDEIESLNRIVTAYLEFAELQTLNRRPMSMVDWIAKLAKEKAEAEFARFKQQQAALPQPVDEHFAKSLDDLKKIESKAKQTQKKSADKPEPKMKAAKKTKSKKRPSSHDSSGEA